MKKLSQSLLKEAEQGMLPSLIRDPLQEYKLSEILLVKKLKIYNKNHNSSNNFTMTKRLTQ